MNPLGYFGLDNSNQEKESVTEREASQIIAACSHRIASKYDKKGGGYQDIIPQPLFNQYDDFIIKQPVEMVQWAVQFAKF